MGASGSDRGHIGFLPDPDVGADAVVIYHAALVKVASVTSATTFAATSYILVIFMTTIVGAVTRVHRMVL